MKFKKLALIGLCIVLCSCRHGGDIQKEDDNNIDIHGADVEGLNDPLETRIEVKVGGIGMNIKGGANFYRGYIDKGTVIPVYQLYIQTKEGEWKYWDKAKYLSPGGLKEYPVTRVGTDVKCSQWGCAHYEDIILSIDRPTLENWSAKDTIVRLSSSKVSGNKDIEVSDGNTKDF